MKKILLLSSILIISSCSHYSKKQPSSSENFSQESFFSQENNLVNSLPSQIDPIPVEENHLVDLWIRYFQTRGRELMERYLSRSSRYGNLMKKILRENALPDDLIYIALIESGFSSKAVSHASAVGYWQFIKSTARRYNLEINSLIDERRDPVLSTQAAALYFKELYSIFGSWYLAMAGYNAGENKILRLVQKYKTRDFWELTKKRRALARETIHYVPKFIAAKLIAENPEKYGFTHIEYEDPLTFETIEVDFSVDLRQMAQNLNIDYEEIKILNPRFKGPIAPPYQQGKVTIRVPVAYKSIALTAAQNSAIDYSQVAFYQSDDIMTHKVRRGESLSSIAKRYQTTVQVLRDLNDLKPYRKLRVGQRLDVPKRMMRLVAHTSASSKGNTHVKPIETDRRQKMTSLGDFAQDIAQENVRFHIVQKGDTLTGISEEYDVTINELLRLNNLRKKSVLRVGMKLKLPSLEPLPASVTEKEGLRSSSRINPSVNNSFNQLVNIKKNIFEQKEKKRFHLVKRGDSLLKISDQYKIPIQELMKINKIKNKNSLRVGKRLVIPVVANHHVVIE